jgi:hypothetical protein
MAILYTQDASGNYIPVSRYPYQSQNSHHHHVGGHSHYPGYHGHSAQNPYPHSHSYGYGIPAGSSYGYVNVPHGAWLGHDWIGLPEEGTAVNDIHNLPNTTP